MTRTETIEKIAAVLDSLPDERLEMLAEITDGWNSEGARPLEDDRTKAAIAEGLAQAQNGDFADSAEVEDLLKRPWK